MRILIPFICALLYRAGGTDQWQWCKINQKLWRWLGIGLLIGILGCIVKHSFVPLLCIPAYYLATNIPYGEKSWLNFLGEYGKFALAGLLLGSCSFILLPFGLAVLQSLLSTISFVVIKILDDKDIIKNPYVEFLRGFFATILLIKI